MSLPSTHHKLEMRAISKQFMQNNTNVHVIEHISICINKGEFVSIIGPSGCGKSTLFHILGGVTFQTSGDIFMDGRKVTGAKGLISYVPQQPALLPWRTIEDNVILGLEINRLSRKDARRLAATWFEKVGLKGYEKAYPHMLSGGMQQRVAFLRALLSPQDVMCLDEPFGALDALTRLEMQKWLLNIWEQNKKTVLLVTHSIEEALLLSDTIYVLSNKPTKVMQKLQVPFPRPRPKDLVHNFEFVQMKQKIYNIMEQERSKKTVSH